MRLEVIAETGEVYQRFSPYVPAVSESGDVVFQATSINGTGLYSLASRALSTVVCLRTDDDLHDVTSIVSHPACTAEGLVCAYTTTVDGTGLHCWWEDTCITVAETGQLVSAIGPLGPTMNEAGWIGFRGTTNHGKEALWLGHHEKGLVEVAVVGETFAAFHGLPVVNAQNQLAFRATSATGHEGLYLFGDGACRCVLSTESGDWLSLGRFPCLDDEGSLFCAGERADNAHVVMRVSCDTQTELVVATDVESIRGVLTSNEGPLLIFATPTGGSLGVYEEEINEAHCIIAFGDSRFGSVVRDFALNPVSMNRRGEWTIRVGLEDGREVICLAV